MVDGGVMGEVRVVVIFCIAVAGNMGGGSRGV